MVADLRSFFGRHSVVELFIAFALATAAACFVASVVDGLIYARITESVSVWDQQAHTMDLATTYQR
jgi:large-conductance mechanosensitive channel